MAFKMAKLLSFTMFLIMATQFKLVPAGFFSDVVDGVCGTVTAVANAKPCIDQLDEAAQPWIDPETKQLPKFIMCCQLNILEDCIARKVKESCNTESKEVVRKVYKTIIATINYVSDDELSCVNDIWYKSESPICWGAGGQIGAGAVAVILILAICCCCCCNSRNRRSKDSSSGSVTTFVHMVPATSVVPQYQQPGGQQPRQNVPYSQLKTAV